jgi:hypothetical protein
VGGNAEEGIRESNMDLLSVLLSIVKRGGVLARPLSYFTLMVQVSKMKFNSSSPNLA